MRGPSKKAAAVIMVTCLLAVAIGGAVITDEADESEGFVFVAVPVGIALKWVILACVGAAVAGAAAGYIYGHDIKPPSETWTRSAEAHAVAASITAGMTWFGNSISNYNQMWTLTNEHWIRQAELSSSFMWSDDVDYDPDTILAVSGVYENSGHMMYNAADQVSKHFESIGDTLDVWNGMDTYKGMMDLRYTYGLGSISAGTAFDGHLVTTAKVDSDSSDKVYLHGGDIWVFGGGATVTGSGGQKIVLPEGKNDLKSVSGFVPDIYEMQTGREYAGSMLSVFAADSAKINSGFVAEADGKSELITYENGHVLSDGNQYPSFDLQIVPEGGTTQTIGLMNALKDYEQMIRTIEDTMGEAVTASGTVWNIYDKAGAASSYLTTLMVPDNYHNVDVSQGQKQILTTLAMDQLSAYAKEHMDEIKTGDYNMTDGSMTLFCRGNIISPTGEVLHENAIFTPFYYSKNQTLNNGENKQTQSSIVAVWEEAGTNLSGWDATSNIAESSLIKLSPGAQIYISEMMFGGEIVNSVDLEINGIDIIDGSKIPPNPLPPDVGDTNWVQIIILIAGIVAVVAGILMGRIDFVLLGIACVAVGWLAGSWLWELIT